jgi:hypothetical protein
MPATRRIIVFIGLGLIALTPTLSTLQLALAANPSGDLRIVPISAYNFVVDSNVTTPATYAPQAGTIGAQFCNDGANDLTDVTVYVGDFNTTVANSTPGVYPVRSTADAGFLTQHPFLAGSVPPTYSLTHQGGSAGTGDATRYIGTIPAGKCVTEYWIVSYPRLKNGDPTVSVTGTIQPQDDLWLNYDFWASATDVATPLLADVTRKVTLRNEISAAANKIWPNTTGKVPAAYLAAIGNTLGWNTFVPGGGTAAYPGQTISTQGIWYDLGNVGAGFDNNGDFVPDRNAWLQPVGDPGLYDPGCFRLVRTYGILVVKLSGGSEMLIPFENQLYFEQIPANNTGVVGLVFYEYVALDGACSATLTPYQEVASGYDNEKFSGDYGSGIPPLQSVAPNMTLTKAGPATSAVNANLTYTINFTNSTYNATSSLGVSVGSPDSGVPFVIEDSIPTGTTYVAGSAALSSAPYVMNGTTRELATCTGLTPTCDIIFYDTVAKAWVTTEPTAANVGKIRWVFLKPLAGPVNGVPGTPNSGQVTFQTNVPSTYLTAGNPPIVNNTGAIKFGDGPAVLQSTASTLISGTYSLSGTVFCDDGSQYTASGACSTTTAGGTLANGLIDAGGSEPGINAVKVSLYYDGNGDGDYSDAVDFLVTTTDTNASGAYTFGSLPAGSYITVVDKTDADLPSGYGISTPSQRTATLSATTTSVTGLDYGFAPPLSITKAVSSATASVGDLLTYTITLTNNLPGSGTASGFCAYNVWAGQANQTSAGNPPGGNAANAQWSSPNNAIGRPDGQFSVTNLSNNADVLGLTKFNTTDMGGTITSVSYRLIVKEVANLQGSGATGDLMKVNIYDGTAVYQTTTYNADTYFTGSTGTVYIVTGTITAPVGGWTFAQFSAATNRWGIQIDSNKASGSVNGDIGLDAAAFVITTNQQCNGADTALSPVPLADVFNNTQLAFISSDPPISSQSPAGTLNWSDVGPIYAGGSRTVTVTMRATGAAAPSTNTATSTGSKFANGASANTPVTSSASVTISTTTATGSITGRLFDDNDGDGWAFAAACTAGTSNPNCSAEAGDTTLQGIRVNLWACIKLADSTLVTTAGTNKTCADQGGEWRLRETTYTDSTGQYTFSTLPQGFYRTIVDTTTVPGSNNNVADPNVSATNTTAFTCASCDNASYGDLRLDNLTFGAITGSNAFYSVNFGYNVSNTLATIGDTLFYDWNGNGVQDAIDEPMSGVQVQLLRADGSVVSTQTTNTAGQYSFANQAAGVYTVRVVASTLPSGVYQTYDPDQVGTCTVCDSQSVVNLNGVNNLTRDFGYKPLGGGSIGDTVWKDMNGDGLQSGVLETGIPNITVSLKVDWNGDGTYVTIATTTTDASGKYLFSSLPAGAYQVVVDTADVDLPKDTQGTTYALNSTYTPSPKAITLTANQTNLTADFAFKPLGAIGDTLFWDANANGQQDWSETGISGVSVQLYTFTDTNGNHRWDAGETIGSLVSSTSTDSLGRYKFTGLSPNNYLVRVPTPPGTLTADPDADGAACPGAGSMCDNQQGVTVYTGTVYMGADFGYKPGIVIGDSLWIDSSNNGVRDAGEAGLSGITVKLCLDAACTSVVATTSTDIDGYYSFNSGTTPALTNGTYYIFVDTTDADYTAKTALGMTQTFEKNSGSPDNVTQVVVSGSAVTQINGTACSNCDLNVDFGYQFVGTRTISGTICLDNPTPNGVCGTTTSGVDANETAYTSETVYLVRWVDNGNGIIDPGETTSITSVQTNASGDYSFGSIPDNGTYLVSVGAPSIGLALTTAAGQTPQNNITAGTNTTTGDTTGAYQKITLIGADVNNVDFAFKPSVNYDYGDLTGTYITTLAQNGPRNSVPSGGATLYLGAVPPDTEPNGVPSAAATGDGADEDGVSLKMNAANTKWDVTCDSNNQNCTASINVTVNGTGWLVGWMDFNGDGDFTDVGEMVVNKAVSTGAGQVMSLALPNGFANTTLSSLNARFRIMPSAPLFSALSFTGLVAGGETEDYAFGPISTTPVSLAYFYATRRGGGINFEWSTSTEAGNVGFNIYVQRGDALTKLNPQLIPSQSTDSISPLTYQYAVRSVLGSVFYIEDVSLTAETRMHGPFEIARTYGERPNESPIDWNAISAEHDKQEGRRQSQNVADAARRSAQAQAVLAGIISGNKNPGGGAGGNGNNPAPGNQNLPSVQNNPVNVAGNQSTVLQPLLDSLDTAWVSGDICKQGVYQSLRQKIENAQLALDQSDVSAALGLLNAFINEVSAQTGKCITQGTADALILQARTVVDQYSTPTAAPEATVTGTPVPSATDTSTPAPTGTPTQIPADTATPTPTDTATPVPTDTATQTPTDTVTPTPTDTATPTPSITPSPTSRPEEDIIADLSQAVSGLSFPVVDLRVNKTGLYRVTYEQLVTAGLDLKNVPIDQIAVANRGASVPIYISGGPLFGPGMYIEFYGKALDTLYTDTNVYWLLVSKGFASSMAVENAVVSSEATFASYYMETASLNRQRGYAFHSPSNDPWYDTSMLVYTSPLSWNYTLQTDNLVASAAPGSLQIRMFGSTDWPDADPDHHVIVNFNGTKLMDDLFNGIAMRDLSAALPSGSLLNGTNTLTLNLPANTGVQYDLVYFDSAVVTYPRAFAARNGSLTFTSAGTAFRVNGLSSQNIVVYRIDPTGKVTRLNGVTVTAQGTTYSATFAGSGQMATYVVSGVASIMTPVLKTEPRLTDITTGNADFLIISHPDFISGLQPLVTARQNQGYTVRVVSTSDIYQQFNYSVFDPAAIQRYIRYTARHMGVRYVLLVGGDMYDYRHYVYPAGISFIPSLYAATDTLIQYAPVDPLYADTNGDSVPDLALGRFPVRTVTELNGLVAKTLAYDNKTYGGTAVFAADISEPGAPFASYSDGFIRQLGGGWGVTRAYLDNSSVVTAQSTLINTINQGVALTNFMGHSSYSIWTFQGLFNSNQAALLTNAGRPTLVTQFGCWNTYYVSPAYNTMAHKLLLSGDRGAAAVMGATTLTQSNSEALLGDLLMLKLATPGETIGDSLLRAKIELAMNHPEMRDVLLGWTLLGDPTMKMVTGGN